MAIVSQKQKEKLLKLVAEGKLSKQVYEKMESESSDKLVKKASYRPKGLTRGVRRLR